MATNYEKFKKRMLKNPKIRAEYDRLGPRYALITAILEARINQGLTQEKLAKKIGTKQSALARFESGNYNPSLDFVEKIAHALGHKIEIIVK